MGAGGDFRDDAAIFGEDVDLGDDDVAQNISAVYDDGSGGLITATFDTENFHW